MSGRTLQMTESPMREKKSEIVGVRFAGSLLRKVCGIADRHGMGKSEWIHQVIAREVAAEEELYRSLHTVFGDEREECKDKDV